MEKKLERNEANKMIGGVCAGLADYFEIEVTWVRIAFMAAVFAGMSGVLIYIILWIAVPQRPTFINPYQTDYRVYEEQAKSQPTPGAPYQYKKQSDTGRIVAGSILIIVGLYFITEQFDLLPYWFSFHKLWPLALVIPGILILLNSSGRNDRIKNNFQANNEPAPQSPSDQL